MCEIIMLYARLASNLLSGVIISQLCQLPIHPLWYYANISV